MYLSLNFSVCGLTEQELYEFAAPTSVKYIEVAINDKKKADRRRQKAVLNATQSNNNN